MSDFVENDVGPQKVTPALAGTTPGSNRCNCSALPPFNRRSVILLWSATSFSVDTTVSTMPTAGIGRPTITPQDKSGNVKRPARP